MDRQIRLVLQKPIHTANEGTTTRHHNAAIHDVAGELRWCDLQSPSDRFDDRLDRFLDALTYFLGMDVDGLYRGDV